MVQLSCTSNSARRGIGKRGSAAGPPPAAARASEVEPVVGDPFDPLPAAPLTAAKTLVGSPSRVAQIAHHGLALVADNFPRVKNAQRIEQLFHFAKDVVEFAVLLADEGRARSPSPCSPLIEPPTSNTSRYKSAARSSILRTSSVCVRSRNGRMCNWPWPTCP